VSHYKPYPVYKDSGVEWLGTVPEHWAVHRMKSLIDSAQNGIWGEDPDGGVDDIACARVADFDRNDFTVKGELPTSRKVPEAQRLSRQVNYGDLLIEKSGGGEQTTVGVVVQYQGEQPVICSNFVAVVKPKNGVKPRWLCYTNAYLYSVSVNTRSIKQTTGIQNIDSDQYFSERVAVPSEAEQHAIAAHLDSETASIDALVEKKARFIELLHEKRQALITHAVTKGLDPKAKMKDSGVEWLGEVPAHWEQAPLKHLISSIGQGWSPECEARKPERGEWGVVKVGCVNGGVFRPQESKALPAAMEPRPELGLRKGDVLVSRANTRELVGSCAVIPQDYPHLLLCDKLYRIGCGARVTPEFLAALITVYGRRAVEIEANGASSSMVNIAQSVILDLLVAVPSNEEQKSIMDRVVVETMRIKTMLVKTERSIALLKERRSALITAAVTGQIDLRQAV